MDAHAAEEKRKAAEVEMAEREKTVMQGPDKVGQQDKACRDTWGENKHEECDMDEGDFNPYEEEDENSVITLLVC